MCRSPASGLSWVMEKWTPELFVSSDLADDLIRSALFFLLFQTTRESLPSNSVSGSQLVSIPPLTPQLSPSEKICFLHAALQACLRLLDTAIAQEDANFPSTPEDEYTKQRRTVRDRLNSLVWSTERLLVGGKRCDAEVLWKILSLLHVVYLFLFVYYSVI